MSCRTESLARAIVARLGGTWHGAYGLCRCPAHDDRNPSLRVAPGQSAVLVHCFAGCRRSDVLRAIRALGELPIPTEEWPAKKAEGADLALIARLWRESRPIGGTPAELYLRHRAISQTSDALRFHPRMFAGPRRYGAAFPALVAAITTDEGVVALQRTFLDPLGRKAAIEAPRRTLGRPGVGAIRLMPAVGPALGLAEGTETALSAAEIHRVPVWATGGVEGFARVAIPERIQEVVLFADSDEGGARAERLFRDRRDQRATIRVSRPPARFGDWNDVAQARRLKGERAGPRAADRSADGKEPHHDHQDDPGRLARHQRAERPEDQQQP